MAMTYGMSAYVEGRTTHFDAPASVSARLAAAIEDPRRLGLEIEFHRIGSGALTFVKPDQYLTSASIKL